LADENSRPWLTCAGLTKAYGGVLALDSASLEIHAGEIRGLVGANGAGKSTLVKLLTGVAHPTSGAVYVDDAPLGLGKPKESLKAGIVSVPQELTIAPTMTVAENIMMGHFPQRGLGFLHAREMRRAAAEVLDTLSLGILPDQTLGDLPIIRQRLVMVARAFSLRARLMIFDEPTATISPREVDFILEAISVLSKRKVSILYVSHRLDEIDAICTEVTVLRDGRVVADLAARDVTHAALVAYLSPGSSEIKPQSTSVAPAPASGEPVLELREVGGAWLDNITLSVRPGEIVGLAGLIGSGAREILLTSCGALPFSRGVIRLCGERVRSGRTPAAVSAGAGFLPGDRSLAAFPRHSVRFNVSLPSLGQHRIGMFVNTRSERSAVAAFLDLVALRRDPETLMSALSGGNQQKAIVARWFASKAKLFLLDDPTSGVDVATRPEIHEQIRAACAKGAGVLLVSTDIDELAELSDRVVVLTRGRMKGELRGGDITPARVLAAMTEQEGAGPREPTA
jgi:monosaccharide-transporting ATPase